MNEFEEITPPAVVFPGQRAEESTYRVAYDLLQRRHASQALELLDGALALDPTNTGLRTLRAWAYLIRAQLERAETELRALVEENPGDDWLRFALGRALERQSRFADALPHLRLAAAMSGDPEHELATLRVERLAGRVG